MVGDRGTPSSSTGAASDEIAIGHDSLHPAKSGLLIGVGDAGVRLSVSDESHRVDSTFWFARAARIAQHSSSRSRACLNDEKRRCDDEVFETTFRALLADPAFLEFVAELLHSMSPDALGALLRDWLDSDDPAQRTVALAAMRSGLLPHTDIPDTALTRSGRSAVEQGHVIEHAVEDSQWTTQRREIFREFAAAGDVRLVRRSLAGLGVQADPGLAGVVAAYSAEQLSVTTSRTAVRALASCGEACIESFATHALTSPAHARVFVESIVGAGPEYRASPVVEDALREVRRVFGRDDAVQGSLDRLP